MIPRSDVRSWRNRYRLLAVTAALAPALILTAPGAAQATTPSPSAARLPATAALLPACPTATLCTFQNANYGGTRWNFAYNNRAHGVWFFVGAGANNKISSMYNRRAWISYFSKVCPANSNWAWVPGGPNGSAIANLNDGQHHWPDGTSANDTISGVALGTSGTASFPQHSGSC